MIDRSARIFTAYVPVLVLIALIDFSTELGHWGQEGISRGAVAFLGNLTLLQDYPAFQVARRLFGDAFYVRPYNTAEPIWAIPVEFWTYVVFGLGFFGLVARERLSATLCVLSLMVALPVVIWNAAAGGGNGLTLVWLLGAAGGYVWVSSWHHSAHKVQIGAAVVLTASICLLGRGLKLGWNFQDLGIVTCEILIILGLISVLDGARALPSSLRAACGFLASYSYSLYLIHNTILIVVKQHLHEAMGRAALPLALIGSHLAAYLVYVLFEQHYRKVGILLKKLFVQPSKARSNVMS